MKGFITYFLIALSLVLSTTIIKASYPGSSPSHSNKGMIGKLSKTKSSWDVWINYDLDCYYLVYRNALTEGEIQAEMKRLSR